MNNTKVGLYPTFLYNIQGMKKLIFCDIDGTIVMDHIILAATALGLGTCYIANFNPEEAEKLIDSHEYIPLLFTPLGHIDAEKRQQTKKTKEELTEYI